MATRAAFSREALELAERTRDDRALRDALSARLWASLGPDHVDERLAVGRELLAFSRRGGGLPMAMLAHDAVTQFLARRDDGSIVGVSTLITFPIPTAVRSWVEDVIVDETSINQGIGRLLVDAMVERARQLGARTVDLTSRPSREAAHHLYRKAGFEVRDTSVYRYEL